MRDTHRVTAAWLAIAFFGVFACGGRSRSEDGSAARGGTGDGAVTSADGSGGSTTSADSAGGMSGTSTEVTGIAGAPVVGVAGSAGTCSCAGFAWEPAVTLTVVPQASSGATIIQNLKADGGDLDITCSPGKGADCRWLCQSLSARVSDGTYVITLRADDYEPYAVKLDVTNPPNCGCCGCPWGGDSDQMIELVPSGTSNSGNCCADLDKDPLNCGACGHACGSLCVDGKCVPVP
jgi:hypothetical protein